MRCATICAALLAMGLSAAQPGHLGPVILPDPPAITMTRAAGLHVRQDLGVQLHRGENRLSLDVSALESDPATVRLRVLEPADGVAVVGAQMGQQPGQMVWLVRAEEPVAARLRLGYEVSYLQADTSYSLFLDPPRQRLQLQGDLTLRNNSRRDMAGVKLALPQGRDTTVTLKVGETVQQRLFTLADVPYELTYLYDTARFQEAVHTMLTVDAAARAETTLPAGKLRVFAPGTGGTPTMVAEVALPYVGAGEKLELDLGVAPEVAVLRNRLRSQQVNVRTDVYKKLAMFDLEEDYELELTSRRQAPVTMVLREHVPGDWEMTRASQPAEPLDSGTMQFTVRVEPGARQKVSYSVKRLNVEP